MHVKKQWFYYLVILQGLVGDFSTFGMAHSHFGVVDGIHCHVMSLGIVMSQFIVTHREHTAVDHSEKLMCYF